MMLSDSKMPYLEVGSPVEERQLMFPKMVKRARQARKLAVANLAARAGLSETYLRNIERGLVKKPSMATVEQLAAALGIPKEQLEDAVRQDVGERAETLPANQVAEQMSLYDSMSMAELAQRVAPLFPDMSTQQLAELFEAFQKLPKDLKEHELRVMRLMLGNE